MTQKKFSAARYSEVEPFQIFWNGIVMVSVAHFFDRTGRKPFLFKIRTGFTFIPLPLLVVFKQKLLQTIILLLAITIISFRNHDLAFQINQSFILPTPYFVLDYPPSLIHYNENGCMPHSSF